MLGTLVLRGINDFREADREVVALSGRIGRPALVMLVSALPASVYALLERAIPPVGSGGGLRDSNQLALHIMGDQRR